MIVNIISGINIKNQQYCVRVCYLILLMMSMADCFSRVLVMKVWGTLIFPSLTCIRVGLRFAVRITWGHTLSAVSTMDTNKLYTHTCIHSWWYWTSLAFWNALCVCWSWVNLQLLVYNSADFSRHWLKFVLDRGHPRALNRLTYSTSVSSSVFTSTPCRAQLIHTGQQLYSETHSIIFNTRNHFPKQALFILPSRPTSLLSFLLMPMTFFPPIIPYFFLLPISSLLSLLSVIPSFFYPFSFLSSPALPFFSILFCYLVL